MAYIACESREINFKVVYCGPGLSGKTTNLAFLHQAVDPQRRGKLLMLNTREERTLFFDFFPLDLGTIHGFKVRFHLYTVPGQTYYRASRKLVLEGADAIVFVADSQAHRLQENLESFRTTREDLISHGIDWANFPVVLQYNKRDCSQPLGIGSLESLAGLADVPVVTAIAKQGDGVMETARRVTRMVIERFQF